MRNIRTAIGVLAALGLAAAPAVAQAGPGGRGGMGRGMAAGGPAAMARNPVEVLLDHGADLALTDEQATRLEAIRDHVAQENGPRWEQLRSAFGDKAPADMTVEERQELRERMRALDPVRSEIRETNRKAMDDARAVLTPEQAEKLPGLMHRGRGAGGGMMRQNGPRAGSGPGPGPRAGR